jgi:hypothetical protein
MFQIIYYSTTSFDLLGTLAGLNIDDKLLLIMQYGILYVRRLEISTGRHSKIHSTISNHKITTHFN